LPDLRFVSIGDINPELGSLAARRFGYERNDTSWQAIAENPDINVVSVVVANNLHREIVEGLVAAGKHVLCEKPLSDTLENARAMADIARSADTAVRIGFTLRRAPGIAALRELVTSGTLGRVLHVDGRYWCDYACDPMAPMSWRFKGAPGTGALADIGSHLAYLVEFLSGDVQEVSGGRFATVIKERPLPLGAVVGHEHVAVSDTYEPVENDDLRQLQCTVRAGVGVVQVSRVAAGHPNGLALEVYGDKGAATLGRRNVRRNSSSCSDEGPIGNLTGSGAVIIGPDHPVLRRSAADGCPRRRHWPQRLHLLPGSRLPSGGGRRHRRGRLLPSQRLVRRRGVHNMEILAAVAESAANDGAAVKVAPQRAETVR
jgi:predicted dehydrogenase